MAPLDMYSTWAKRITILRQPAAIRRTRCSLSSLTTRGSRGKKLLVVDCATVTSPDVSSWTTDCGLALASTAVAVGGLLLPNDRGRWRAGSIG